MLRHIALYPRRHWQGRIAILPTALLSLIGLRLALDAALALRPASWPLPPVIALSLLSGAVLVWQITGGLRSTARAGRDLVAAILGLLAVIATAVLFLSAELTHWAGRNARPPDLPGPPQPYPVTAGTARIEGPIGFDTLARLRATLAVPGHGLATLELASDGGRVPAARALALRVEAAGLDTRATGLCASACTLVFLAGARRSLGPGGALGFHAYSLNRFDTLQTTLDEQARDRAWMAARGVAPGFIDRIFATPPDALWHPSADELRAAGWLTD